jgi:hypothetical protein
VSSPVYILASNGREAAAIARARGLRRSQWRICGRLAGRGLVGATVLVTPCWSHWRPEEYVESVNANLRIGRAKIKRVRCPAA